MERIKPKKLADDGNVPPRVRPAKPIDKMVEETAQIVAEEFGTSKDRLFGRVPRDRPPTDFNPFGDPVHVQVKPQGANVLTYRERAYADGTATRAYYVGTLLVGIATLSPSMLTFKYHHLNRGDMVDRYETEAALHKALRLMVQDAEA